MKNPVEKFEIKGSESDFDRQYDNPEALKFGKDKLEIYDVRPEHPKEAPAVFAPGWLPNPKINKDIIKTLFEEGRRALSFYAPHGIEPESIKDEEAAKNVAYAELRRIAALVKTLEEKELNKVDAFGHSEGGMYLAFAALMYPEKFRNLVLVDPAGIIGKDNAFRLITGTFKDLSAQMKRQKKRLRPEEKELPKPDKYLWNFIKTGPLLGLKEIAAMANVDILDVLAALKERGVGVSIIHGVDDRYFPMERVQKMVKVNQIDGFYSVAGSHMEIITQPALYTRLVEQAFTDLENKKQGRASSYKKYPDSLN